MNTVVQVAAGIVLGDPLMITLVVSALLSLAALFLFVGRLVDNRL